ncbi:trans-sialidase, putative [Trypanosoma cruzi marinkellei]|uniref:Trans-sialidase, putative n=1 Tax=Trypanosoma cruzi marinkellei TaxID=85056 RepID=K2MQE5_TRYCR|nr:trans-sialidase, putative [Trypanosoma cruzi marinkellei]
MSRRVFTSAVLLLLVVMMCCGAGGGAAQAPEVPPVDLEASSGKHFVWKEKKEGETVESLHVPSLVEMNGDVFAVAEADCKKKKDGDKEYFPCIASDLLEWTDGQSKELDTVQVKTQVLEECPSDNANCASREVVNAVSQENRVVDVSRPTTVVNGSDIYMLAGTYMREGAANAHSPAMARRGLLLSRGNVNGEDRDRNKRIYWNYIDSFRSTSNIEGRESFTELTGGGGSGVNMKDGTLVFPVEGTKKQSSTEGNQMEKTVSLILYLKDTKSWTLSKGTSADGCSDPSVVEWKDKKLIMMTACDDGRRRVYESDDMGDSWTEALGTLSRVWGKNEEGRDKGVGSGFITARIEHRDVMLVTLPVYAKREQK